MGRPITPKEAEELHPLESIIPEEMVNIVNEILKEKYNQGKKIDITIEDIRKRWDKLENKPPLLNEYLDFEPLFVKAGWNCKWVKESNWRESGYDRYEFTPKKKK